VTVARRRRKGVASDTTTTTTASTSSRTRGVLLDTGVLVALYARDDPRHLAVARWLATFRGELHTVDAVLTESAFFMPVHLRPTIAELVERGIVRVHHPDLSGYARIAALLRKYADVDPDWADIALVWLAETTGISRIATIDVADFSIYRIHGRKRFELELLR
jgi:predicted nucleic acid-binding protein